jgi:aspartyl aminopeptidase
MTTIPFIDAEDLGSKKSEKTKELKEKLFGKAKPIFDKLSDAEREAVNSYCDSYIFFLNQNKTEYQVIDAFRAGLLNSGFYADWSGQRFFEVRDNRTMAVAVMGSKDILEGVRIITSHVDSPRIDLKPRTLYEDSGLAFLKTHYYGGIKKYQWLSRELALIGYVVLKNGERVNIRIGTEPSDPVLIIPDLLPHLSKEQMGKEAGKFVPGESLNVIIGTNPHPDKEEDERVKLAIMEMLHTRYDIVEEDLFSSNLQLVPAATARYCGLDKSLIAGYGQDDRVCAYPSYTAIRDLVDPTYTSIAVFYDKEEIGSDGRTGAQSQFFESFLMKILKTKTNHGVYKQVVHEILEKSKALSADVTCAYDPNFADVSEKMNVANLGYGVAIERYSGHGGKYEGSEASSEYTAWIRDFCERNSISWQIGGLGKIDEGGGGTVANYLAIAGVNIIDIGPAVLGMHSPVEVTSKYDVWMCSKLFNAFFKDK